MLPITGTSRIKSEPSTVITFEVKNFGPIKSGKLELAPLTIITGPNSSGKSYLALALHTLISAHGSTISHNGYFEELPVGDNFTATLSGGPKGLRFEPEPEPEVRDYFYPLLRELPETLRRQVHQGLSSNFGASPGDLKRKSDKRTKLELSGPASRVSYNLLKTGLKLDSSYRLCYRMFNHVDEVRRGKVSFWLMDPPDLVSESHYLPAARTGLMHTFSTLAAEWIRMKPRRNLATTSGVVIDFVSTLLRCRGTTIDEDLFEWTEVATFLEQEMLGGRVHFSDEEGVAQPVFQLGNQELPPSRVSSMVTELMPIILYLRHIFYPDTLLIIEEPEAHLHPANQRIFAKALARLANTGMRVLITTHSDYLVQQLGNSVLASNVSRSNRQEFPESEVLKVENVRAYKMDVDGDGASTLKPLPVSVDFGIEVDSFVDEALDLSDQSAALQDAQEH